MQASSVPKALCTAITLIALPIIHSSASLLLCQGHSPRSIPEFFRRRNEPPAKVQHHLKTQRSVHGVTYDSSIRRAGFRMLRRKAASDWKDSRKKFPVISSPPPARLEIGFLDQRVQVRLKLRLLLA